VGELVHERQSRPALEHGVHVEVLQAHAVVLDAATRHRLEPREKGLGLLAPVGLHVGNDHIDAFALALPGRRQHRVRLADAGRVAEEHLQPAAFAPPLLSLNPVE